MNNSSPLADRVRPQKLADFVGQKQLVGQNGPLRLMLERGQVFSLIFWGPPGCGKTTLARIIAQESGLDFFQLSAVSARKDDLRKIIQSIEKGLYPHGSVVFLDEIHRFNKAQQDYLLPFVEKGTITLIGATTENPSFEVIGPLLSRSRVFVLQSLSAAEMVLIIKKGLAVLKKEKGLKGLSLEKKAEKFLIDFSAGDARVALSTLEAVLNLYKFTSDRGSISIKIKLEEIENVLQKKALRYDKAGEEHYNTISAFIKSMRASNVNAALYYLARMVEAGEDPLFIARRMVILLQKM